MQDLPIMKYYPLRGLRAKGRLIQKNPQFADSYEIYFKE